MGWFGYAREVKFYLSTVNADKDAEGRFIISGAPVISGLDDAEVVVPDETCYFVDGKKKSLAAGLGSTSYGMKVKVF